MDDSLRIAQLEAEVKELRELFFRHLGPKFAASSLNIPHPELATRQELIQLIGQAGRYL